MNCKTVDMWVKELQEQKQNLETEFMERCRERYEGSERFAYLPGPVGDLPVHNCLLLGLQDLTKKLVDELHSPSVQHVYLQGIHDVNTPFKSDLDAWKEMQILRTVHPYDDRGLFTGETLLHIAVGQGDTEMVRWLIEDKGASIAAQAVGAFFKPKQLILSKTESAMIVGCWFRELLWSSLGSSYCQRPRPSSRGVQQACRRYGHTACFMPPSREGIGILQKP